MKKAPKVLTRMRLSCCWGDNLDVKELNDVVDYINELEHQVKKQKEKLSKIETLIINHNCDTGDIYYKYNSKFLKSELKQRILEILYEEGSDE